METRVAKLEAIAEKTTERLGSIERDLAVIKSNYATKADVLSTKADIADAKSGVIMWVVSAVLLAQVLPGLMKHLGI